MNIPHQNETLEPAQEPCFEHGHWFIRNGDRALFIVPDDRLGTAEVYGPDDETLQALNDFYRKAEDGTDLEWFDKLDVQALCLDLDLTFAYDWQRRFDRQAGWYTV